jgi:hypothetical protein
MANTLDGYDINILYFEESYHESTILTDLNTYSIVNGFTITSTSIKRDFILDYVEDITWNSSATKNFITKYYNKSIINLTLSSPISLSLNVIISQIRVNEQNNIRYVKLRLNEV